MIKNDDGAHYIKYQEKLWIRQKKRRKERKSESTVDAQKTSYDIKSSSKELKPKPFLRI